jgi:hypothetical protein
VTGIRVYIPTTEGPSEIQRITPEDPDVRSVICLDGKAIALPISADYDAFVRAPTGVIEARFGQSVFRLDVSQDVTDGLSWQLAVYAAHALQAAGKFAMREQAAHRAIWLTGEVDCALNIRPVDHVARKLRQSGRLITDLAMAGTPLTIYVPRQNFAELDDETLRAAGINDLTCRLVPVDEIADVLADLRLPVRSRSTPFRHSPKTLRWSRWITAPLAICAGLSVMAVGANLSTSVKDVAVVSPPKPLLQQVSMTTAPDPVVAQTLSFVSVNTVAPRGESCTGADLIVSRNILPATGQLNSVRASSLCDLRYRLTNSGNAPLNIMAVGARRDATANNYRTRIFLEDYLLRPGAYVDLDARPPRIVTAALSQIFLIAALSTSEASRRAMLKALIRTAGKPMEQKSWSLWRDRMVRASGTNLTRSTQEIHP